ncbi:acyl-CoA N-acyltransferase [Paraphysoderma sedebokerense]|nr:acyl-CoA N-acyltransferase [Paraphysoderma sedebokerense]
MLSSTSHSSTNPSSLSPKPKTTINPKYSRIALGEINKNNVNQIRTLNSVIFPVTYNDKFYKDILEVGEYAKMAYYNDICVGGVCCRKEPITPASTPSSGGKDKDSYKLYIMTLGVLAAYRRLGIGTDLLNHILTHAQSDPKAAEVWLHVQTSNTDALDFYKKHGFEVKETVKDYYKNISPTDAYILVKKFERSSK